MKLSFEARVFVVALLGAVLPVSCDDKQCDKEGCECVDNKKYCCEFSDGLGTSESSDYFLAGDCEEIGTTCVEHGEGSAYCEYTEIECTEDKHYICVGDIVAVCYEGHQHPVPSIDCKESSDERICCYTAPGNEAECCLLD